MFSHKRKHEKEDSLSASPKPTMVPTKLNPLVLAAPRPVQPRPIESALTFHQPIKFERGKTNSKIQPIAYQEPLPVADDAPLINLENLQKPIDLLQQVTAGNGRVGVVKAVSFRREGVGGGGGQVMFSLFCLLACACSA